MRSALRQVLLRKTASSGAPSGSCTIADPGTVYEGVSATFSAATTGDVDSVDFYWSDDGNTWHELGTDSSGTTSWSVAGVIDASGPVTIRARAYASAEVVATGTRVLTVAPPPTIALSDPGPLSLGAPADLSVEASAPIDSVEFGIDYGTGEERGQAEVSLARLAWNSSATAATVYAHGMVGTSEVVSASRVVDIVQPDHWLLRQLRLYADVVAAWWPGIGRTERVDGATTYLASWLDLSGAYTFAQAVDSKQMVCAPTGWNGRASVYSDSTRSTIMSCTDAALLANFSGDDTDLALFIAQDSVSTTATRIGLFGAGSANQLHLHTNSSGTAIFYIDTTNCASVAQGSGRRHSLVMRDGTATSMWRNGSRISGPATRDRPAQTYSRFSVGGYKTDTTEQWFSTGNIGLVMAARSVSEPLKLTQFLETCGYTYE